jgi:hypothetical protein
MKIQANFPNKDGSELVKRFHLQAGLATEGRGLHSLNEQI